MQAVQAVAWADLFLFGLLRGQNLAATRLPGCGTRASNASSVCSRHIILPSPGNARKPIDPIDPVAACQRTAKAAVEALAKSYHDTGCCQQKRHENKAATLSFSSVPSVRIVSAATILLLSETLTEGSTNRSDCTCA